MDSKARLMFSIQRRTGMSAYVRSWWVSMLRFGSRACSIRHRRHYGIRADNLHRARKWLMAMVASCAVYARRRDVMTSLNNVVYHMASNWTIFEHHDTAMNDVVTSLYYTEQIRGVMVIWKPLWHSYSPSTPLGYLNNDKWSNVTSLRLWVCNVLFISVFTYLSQCATLVKHAHKLYCLMCEYDTVFWKSLSTLATVGVWRHHVIVRIQRACARIFNTCLSSRDYNRNEIAPNVVVGLRI